MELGSRITNTTSHPRAAIAAALAGAGFPVSAADILTAPTIAAAYLNENYPGARCLLLNSGEIGEDLAGVNIAGAGDPAPVEVVLVGGADVLGAQRHGLTGVLVKTGKYLPGTHRTASGTPDYVIDSFAGLPALIERLP